MTREEFQTAQFSHGPAVFASLVEVHGLTAEQANAEIQQMLEREFKAYIQQQVNKITSIEI